MISFIPSTAIPLAFYHRLSAFAIQLYTLLYNYILWTIHQDQAVTDIAHKKEARQVTAFATTHRESNTKSCAKLQMIGLKLPPPVLKYVNICVKGRKEPKRTGKNQIQITFWPFCTPNSRLKVTTRANASARY